MDSTLRETHRRGSSLRGLLGFCFISIASAAVRLHALSAAPQHTQSAASSSGPSSTPPRQWAADAATNELKALQVTGIYLRYRMHTVDAKGDQVREIIQSKDGAVARLIARDNRPLTDEEDREERARLQTLLDSPAAFQKHIHSDSGGRKMVVDLIQLMPEAMIYTYAAAQPQREGVKANPAEIVLDFQPDPKWSSPTLVANALTGLKGRLWIDPTTHFLTRLDGSLFQGVNVGFGALAHVYPGGQISFEQAEVAGQRWMFTHFVEHLTIRALLLKTVRENSDLQGSDFTLVQPMSYQDAIHLLLASPLPR